MNKTVFTVAPALKLTLELEEPRFGLRPEDLFQLAVRQNSQRAFLFVSKALGKHLPIHPAVLPSAGKLLALAWTGGEGGADWSGILKGGAVPSFPEIWARLERSRYRLGPTDRTLFVGFAETATGLSRAVADCFTGEMAYISTTRLDGTSASPLTFDEAHSHARTHLLHLSPDDPFMTACRQAVLIDDELTTGNTALRLIRQLHAVYGIRRFTLMTLLDNSMDAPRKTVEQELGIEIRVVSLLHGRIVQAETGTLPPLSLAEYSGLDGETPELLDLPGLPLSDRFLQSAEALECQRDRIRSVSEQLSTELSGQNTLYLGTGEFIYAPALIAGFCGGSRFHSTTQSPVFPMAGSAITSGGRFAPLDCYSPIGYLYNVLEGVYREAVVLAERETMRLSGLRQLTAYLKSRGIKKVRVVSL